MLSSSPADFADKRPHELAGACASESRGTPLAICRIVLMTNVRVVDAMPQT